MKKRVTIKQVSLFVIILLVIVFFSGIQPSFEFSENGERTFTLEFKQLPNFLLAKSYFTLEKQIELQIPVVRSSPERLLETSCKNFPEGPISDYDFAECSGELNIVFENTNLFLTTDNKRKIQKICANSPSSPLCYLEESDLEEVALQPPSSCSWPDSDAYDPYNPNYDPLQHDWCCQQNREDCHDKCGDLECEVACAEEQVDCLEAIYHDEEDENHCIYGDPLGDPPDVPLGEVCPSGICSGEMVNPICCAGECTSPSKFCASMDPPGEFCGWRQRCEGSYTIHTEYDLACCQGACVDIPRGPPPSCSEPWDPWWWWPFGDCSIEIICFPDLYADRIECLPEGGECLQWQYSPLIIPNGGGGGLNKPIIPHEVPTEIPAPTEIPRPCGDDKWWEDALEEILGHYEIRISC